MAKTPFIGPFWASLNAALTSSAVMPFFSTLTTKSTTETFGVGTLNAIPFNLPFNCGKTKRNSLGGAGGGRHNVQGRSARTSQVSVRGIQDSLITSVGVSGGHRTLDDAELVVQNLGERRQAVGGARRVGDDVGRVSYWSALTPTT